MRSRIRDHSTGLYKIFVYGPGRAGPKQRRAGPGRAMTFRPAQSSGLQKLKATHRQPAKLLACRIEKARQKLCTSSRVRARTD